MHDRTGPLDEHVLRPHLRVVPVSGVSHAASRRLNRQCDQPGTTALWLPRSGAPAFERALAWHAARNPETCP